MGGHPPAALATPEAEHRFPPCDQCGGADLRFDPQAGRLSCDHCGFTAPPLEGHAAKVEAIRELDFRAAWTPNCPKPRSKRPGSRNVRIVQRKSPWTPMCTPQNVRSVQPPRW